MGPPTFPATSRTCSFAQRVLADNHSTGNSRSHYLHTTWIRFLPDGGARFPTCPEARLATLSVVQDLAGSESDRKSVVDSFFISKPVFAYFHVAAVGLVQGYQTVARADLMAFFFCCQDGLEGAWRTTAWICDRCPIRLLCIIHLIETGQYKMFLHKLPNADLISELAEYWRPDEFHTKKVKSNQSFEDAKNLEEL